MCMCRHDRKFVQSIQDCRVPTVGQYGDEVFHFSAQADNLMVVYIMEENAGRSWAADGSFCAYACHSCDKAMRFSFFTTG